MPLVLARIYEEDIKFDTNATKNRVIRTSPTSANSPSTKTEEERFMENLTSHIDHRNTAARSSVALDNLEVNLAHSAKAKNR